MRFKLVIVGLCLLFLISCFGCSKVPAGTVGVKVYLLGGAKGVDSEELGPGRYWIGWNEELYLFPTFTQNYVWTKNPQEGSLNDESISFQTTEGLVVNADVGISYHILPDKVNEIFQKYRKGVMEITDIYLRNMVRDALVEKGSVKAIESVYGNGKADLMNEVEIRVKGQVEPIGIMVEKIYWIGELRLPETVVEAINAKIQATQRAQQRANEVAEARAAADKVRAVAQGDADAVFTKAEAQAKANLLLSASITPELVKWQALQKWDGILPKITSGAVPFINVDSIQNSEGK